MPVSLAQCGLFGIGLVVGACGTLIGAGGGFVLVPILFFLYPETRSETITAISLAVVFANATSGSVAYARMKRVDYRSGGLFALAATPTAIVGAVATAHLPRHIFGGIFGGLMLVACAFLLAHPTCESEQEGKRDGRRHLTRHLIEADGTPHTFAFNPVTGIVLSVFVGFLSSLLGIGGGIVHVPALTHLLHFPVHIATATSHFALAISTLVATVVHLVRGELAHVLDRVIPLAFGVVLGAQVGAHLSHRVKGVWIVRGLAIALGLAAVRVIWQAMA